MKERRTLLGTANEQGQVHYIKVGSLEPRQGEPSEILRAWCEPAERLQGLLALGNLAQLSSRSAILADHTTSYRESWPKDGRAEIALDEASFRNEAVRHGVELAALLSEQRWRVWLLVPSRGLEITGQAIDSLIVARELAARATLALATSEGTTGARTVALRTQAREDLRECARLAALTIDEKALPNSEWAALVATSTGRWDADRGSRPRHPIRSAIASAVKAGEDIARTIERVQQLQERFRDAEPDEPLWEWQVKPEAAQ